MQTLTRRGVRDAAAGLGLHFLHMSEGPFSHDAGKMTLYESIIRVAEFPRLSGKDATGQTYNVCFVSSVILRSQ